MPKWQAILFDLDGTLIDSEQWHHRAEIETYSKFGFTPTEEEMKRGVGIPMSVTVARLATEHGVDMTPGSFREAHRPRLSAYVRDCMQLFEDVVDCLDHVRGVPLALVTSSERWYVDDVVQKFSRELGAFDVIITSDDVSRGKPDPEPYLIAARQLGVSPSECLAVEDSANGIASAVAAECRVAIIARSGKGPEAPARALHMKSLRELR
ncbi:MAG: HAD family phosphatase [Fimbriimonadales bacterium]